MNIFKDKKFIPQSANGKFFSATWIKADGTTRKMLCQIPTNEKFFSGGELKGNREHLVECIDVVFYRKNNDNTKKSWRSFNLNTLTSLIIGGVEWVK